MAKITFYGNMTAEPRTTQKDGMTTMHISVASRTSRKGSDGNYITNFIDVTLFGKRAEMLESKLQKGTCVFVSGDFAAVPYQTKEGAQRISLSVTADTVDPIMRMKDSNSETRAKASAAPAPVDESSVVAEDDDLPF